VKYQESGISRATIAETWEASIQHLLTRTESPIVDTDTGGATIEAENILLRVSEPLREPRISGRYVDPELIEGYGGLFTRPPKRSPDDAVTVADRIYAWPTTSGKALDQFQKVVRELKSNPTSRRALIQIWNPESDLNSKSGGVPSGHCYFYLAVREGLLNITANSRSIDAWIGELPNLLTLAKLQQEVAKRLSLQVGSLAHFVMSYHIYLRDIPDAMRAFGAR
jgi:hypothetical protein